LYSMIKRHKLGGNEGANESKRTISSEESPTDAGESSGDSSGI